MISLGGIFWNEEPHIRLDYWKDAPVWTPERIAKETKDWFRYLGSEK